MITVTALSGNGLPDDLAAVGVPVHSAADGPVLACDPSVIDGVTLPASLDAAWCERHGLYTQLYSDEAAMDSALNARAKVLAASNPEAMAKLKKIFWAGTDHWEQLLDERAAMSGALVLSDFTRRAIAAFRKS